jgi:hypothetical protein
MKFTIIKNTKLQDGKLQGDGYALASRISINSECAVFEIKNTAHADYSFVFAFEGVGHHCRMEVLPSQNLILLYFIRDGIPIYLQHASLSIPPEQTITLYWEADSIRVHLGFTNIINILGEGLSSGHWGFATRDTPYKIPEVLVQFTPLTQFQWICLGDGYSNNRWKNRHLFSWPELAFGNGGTHLNACVAAGNTRRTLKVLEFIRHRVAGASVFIAAGADDLIESEPLEGFLSRLSTLVENTRCAGAKSIHLCAIPPSTRNNEEIIKRNHAIHELSQKNGIAFIDFHQCLSPAMPGILVGGGYPGPEAQRMIATLVLKQLGIQTTISPLIHVERKPKVHGLMTRALSRAQICIDSILGRLP